MTQRLTEAALPREVRIPDSPLDAVPAPETLSHPLRAQGDRVELSARRVRAVLSGTEGIQWLEGDGRALVANLLVEGASAANLVVSPRSARRECFAGGTGFMEVLQIPEALPGAVIQWQWNSPEPLASLPVRFRVLPRRTGEEGEPLHFHRAPGLLWVGQGDDGVLVAAPGSLALPLIRRTGRVVQVEWDLPRDEDPSVPVSLLIQSAPPDAPWTNPGALAAVAAHFRRGEEAAAGTHERGVDLLTGVDEMDEGFQWTRAWIRDRLLAVPRSEPLLHPVDVSGALGEEDPWLGPGTGAAWLAMAAAGTGDREAGRGALRGLSWEGIHPSLLSALALARWTAWTGETEPLSGARDALLEVLGPSTPLDGNGGERSLVSGEVLKAVRGEVAAAGEAAEDPDLKALKELAVPGAGSGMRLPTVGGAAAALDPRVFPFHPSRNPEERLAQALQARALLGEISRDATRLRQGAGAVAAVLWMYGILGAQPDATFERLTLAPLFPPNWKKAGLSGIRVGEGALALGYTRDGGAVRWTLRPLEGSTPLMVILDAWQPLGEVAALTVDGAPAELDVHTEGGWSRVQSQIPADAPRVVEIRGEG